MAFQTSVKVELYANKVRRRIGAKRKRVLFRQGGYLRRTMQWAMRYRKGPSKIGDPPSAHKRTGALLRKLIGFFVDLQEGSVVCGPERDGAKSQPSGKPVPELLDKGGPVFAHLKGEQVLANVAPRPFTAPVFTDGGENFQKLLETERL